MLLASLTVLAVAATPQLTGPDLDAVLGAARTSPEQLAVERELADAARELTLSRGLLLGGPSLGFAAGPRRGPEGDDTDLAFDVDLPLAADRAPWRAAVEALRAAERSLPAAAAVEASLALHLSYVDAWEAGEARRLAERAVEAASDWLTAVEARVAEGADAAYESTLVAAELADSLLVLAAAREREQVAWNALRARAAVPAEPLPLPTPAARERSVDSPTRGQGALARAVELRGELDGALLALESARAASRWALVGALAREGEEEVARLGLGYRLPLAGETRARATALESALVERARRTEIELASLAGRLAGARARLATLESRPGLSTDEVGRALGALDARLAAGRERPSSMLPLRRQLLGALTSELEHRAARLRSGYEIDALTTETHR